MLRTRTRDRLKLGEQFVRVNDPETRWTVRRVVALPHLPPHAELVSDGLHRRRVLVSAAALRDRRQYRPAVAAKPMLAAQRPASRARGWRSLFGW